MHTFLQYFQLAVSVLLIVSILTQNRSAGLSSVFGGSGAIHTTKRGAEKIVFNATVVLAVLFILSSAAFLFVR
jgi:preprotein translocase subunit SecG